MNVSGNFMRAFQLLNILFIVSLLYGISSCAENKKPFREEDKIFHAAPQGNGIASLSFALYSGNRYQIMNSGGIGADYFSGIYSLKGDTIIFNDLSKGSSLKSNRLKIFRYNQQDSTYWIWKHAKSLRHRNWQVFEEQDKQIGDGDVYQLDGKNKPMIDEYHFIIRLDSLQKSFR